MKSRLKLLLAIIFSCLAMTNSYAFEEKKLDMLDKASGTWIYPIKELRKFRMKFKNQLIILSAGIAFAGNCFIAKITPLLLSEGNGNKRSCLMPESCGMHYEDINTWKKRL